MFDPACDAGAMIGLATASTMSRCASIAATFPASAVPSNRAWSSAMDLLGACAHAPSIAAIASRTGMPGLMECRPPVRPGGRRWSHPVARSTCRARQHRSGTRRCSHRPRWGPPPPAARGRAATRPIRPPSWKDPAPAGWNPRASVPLPGCKSGTREPDPSTTASRPSHSCRPPAAARPRPARAPPSRQLAGAAPAPDCRVGRSWQTGVASRPPHPPARLPAASTRAAGAALAQTVRGTDRSVQDGGPASRLAAASGSPATHAAWPPRQARNPCLDPVGRSWLPDLLRAGPAAQGRDHVAQLHPGMEQARLDRPDGALKDGGDLVEAVADAVDQFDDHSLVGAPVLEGPVQQVTQFSILVRVHAALEFREDGVVDRLVTLAAQCLEPAAIGNPHQPGRDACIAAEVACLPPGDPETVVDDFLDDVLASRQA